MFDQTCSARGEQRRKQEEIARRNDDDIVVFSIEFFEERDGAPTSSYFGQLRQSEREKERKKCQKKEKEKKKKNAPKMTRVFFDGSGSICSAGWRKR